MDCFRDVIASFPTRKTLADGAGVTVPCVNIWFHRDRIPASRWAGVVASARKNGVNGITPELLLRIASQTLPQLEGEKHVNN